MLVLAHLHRSVLTQQVHSLGHLAFKWRSSFDKALAKLSPNFREKSPNSFYKMIHIYIINTKNKYLQCNLDMCTWTFAKTFAKKNTFAISEKTLAETVNCIPKGLRKGNPFQGPFAQLSYTVYHLCEYFQICNMMYKFIILCGRYRFFSSLSFYHGLDMFLATRDPLVINGNYPSFFTSSHGQCVYAQNQNSR